MRRGRFPRDSRFPDFIWAIYDHQIDCLLERYKSKTSGDRSYVKIYKSKESALNYIHNYLKDDFERYEIRAYKCLANEI